MTHIRPALYAGLGIVFVLSACNKSSSTVDPQQFSAEIAKYREEDMAKIDSTNAHDAALNRKLNEINARVDKLQEASDRLTAELTAYKELPDVRLEIIPEVTSRFQIVNQAQDQFVKSIRDSVTMRATATQDTMTTRIAVMQNILNEHMAFVQFVATEQDSINRVFANRIDSRPWYVSFMGKWEDRQRARKSAETP
jgi:vacuolar-type H+-ATPase subunit I/STV1